MVSSKHSIQISFGKKVRDLRIKRGYSQEAFAFECGLHRTYIGCIERGEKNITIVNIEKIAKALKVEVYKLFQE
ncbi:MAG: XRE family transcriptional regulator [Proteobacteria bacterium]|nr:XRE family transcriptional regulator [Pseudomonadota bacterium]